MEVVAFFQVYFMEELLPTYHVRSQAGIASILLLAGTVLVVVIGLVFFLKSSSPSPLTPTEPPLTVSTTPSQEKENVTELKGELVAGTPEFPVYPGAQVKKSYKKDIDQKTDYVVVWEAKGAVPQTMAWYAAELKKSGWQIEGPDFPEAKDEQQLIATNDTYKVKLIVGLEFDEETGQEGLNILAEFLNN